MTSRTDEYKSEMKTVSLTEEEQNRLVATMAARFAGKGEVIAMRPRTARRPHRLAVAAVAAGLALAVGLGGYAYASGQLVSVADLVASAFGAGPAKTEVVNKVGRPVGASVTHDGITVSADAIMGDDHSYVVVYSIRRTDGQPVAELAPGSTPGGDYTSKLADGRLLIPQLEQTVDGATAEGGAQWIYDADPDDNALQVVVAYGTDTNVVGRTVHTRFAGLTTFDEGDGAEESLVSGTWDLAFKLDYESYAVTLGGGQRVTLPETQTGATIGQVSVSAVGVTVDYTADATDVDDVPEDLPDGYWDGPTVLDLGDITVTLKDGSQLVVSGAGGTAQDNPEGGEDCRVTGFFDRVIDPAGVASVSLCGVEVQSQ